jgi:hypothetical protein
VSALASHSDADFSNKHKGYYCHYMLRLLKPVLEEPCHQLANLFYMTAEEVVSAIDYFYLFGFGESLR